MNINLFDLHTDLPTAAGLDGNNLNVAKRNSQSGIFAINAVYGGGRSLNDALKIATAFSLAHLPIAFEDACYEDYLLSNLTQKEEGVINLSSKLCAFNPLYISLGWNYDNLFAGGCAQKGGLTKYGEIFISALNGNKLAVDVAHSNKNSFYQIVGRAKRVLCSHTAFEWIYPHRRNLDEMQVKAILNKGGIIGLIGVGHFLSGVKNAKGREDAFFNQIDGYVKKFGVNGLAIGSDFYGSDAPIFADGDYTFVKKLTQVLQKKGIKSGDIERILYTNARLFFNIKA